MIKALSLAAALALLPISAAVAGDVRGPSEEALEAAAEAFEARMETFGERAEAISEDASLTDEQKGQRIAALWTEYQPDITAFTTLASQVAPAIAAEALADIDVEALVSDAMSQADVAGALAAAQGVASNGAWASNDPEHMATYGLMADYAVGEAMDSLDEASAEIAAATAEADAEMADAAAEVAAADED
ncbi:hypothetical protein [uncultured Brevundimonas sp.]|uniref:hypothetical protein n=1 Tax=uncultured Brevundimonas sp. TaxID=213418 RepID=UPI0025F68B8A|nr:hypothetical protein [uncultured Brevundimonas sp.]